MPDPPPRGTGVSELPWKGRRLHVIGVGGAGMSAYARAAAALGAEVSGSDRSASPFTADLARDGVLVAAIGHAPQNVPDGADVVHSSAVAEDNPERAEARRRGLRELTRARGASVVDRRAKCQQVSSMLLRLGRHYPGKKTWGKAHMAWLAGQKLEHLEQRIALEERLVAVRQAQERIERLERAIREAVPAWSLAPLVTALMALRGVAFIAATTLLAEIGDLGRFRTPRELMAWLGLVPSEFSTGEDTRRGPITKAGNLRARQILIECAWSYRHPPRIGTGKLVKVAAAPPVVRDIAWKAQVRLTGRYRSLCRAGKPDVVAITAVAREMSGFIWAIARALAANAAAAAADAKPTDADNGSGGTCPATTPSVISSRNGIQGTSEHGTRTTGRTRTERRRAPGTLPDTARHGGADATDAASADTATQPQPGAALARGGRRDRRLAGGVCRMAASHAGGNP